MQPSLNAALVLTSHAATLVAQFEGDKHVAYRDGNGIWTIGYGHTGPEVHAGLVWTEAQAVAALTHDLLTADNDIESLVTVPLNQNEFDALVSFDYNLGEGHVRSSTTLRKLNAGDRQGAADAMLLWDKIAGADSPGLLARREAERTLFLKAA
jgi:lysozyme